MTYEFDEMILLNKIYNMSLSELFLFDPVKAVEKIIGYSFDFEEENYHPLLVNALKVHGECFKIKINEVKEKQSHSLNRVRRAN